VRELWRQLLVLPVLGLTLVDVTDAKETDLADSIERLTNPLGRCNYNVVKLDTTCSVLYLEVALLNIKHGYGSSGQIAAIPIA
jgi:hypothetical protein